MHDAAIIIIIIYSKGANMKANFFAKSLAIIFYNNYASKVNN